MKKTKIQTVQAGISLILLAVRRSLLGGVLGVSGPEKVQILENLLCFCLRNPVFYDQKPDFFSACGGPFYLSLVVKVSLARRRREKNRGFALYTVGK